MRRILEGKGICWRVWVLVLACWLHSCLGVPLGYPVKYSLNTNNANHRDVAPQTGSVIEQGRELLGRIADAIRIGTGRFVNSVTLARNIIAGRWEALASQNDVVPESATKTTEAPREQVQLEYTSQYPVVSSTRPGTRETARLLTQSGQAILEKPISKPITGILESILRPVPVVDNIREEERYGNTDGRVKGLSTALVNGYEEFTNFLNSFIEFPRSAAQRKSQGLTDILSRVGERLIGFV
ncbi:uncharacterized protein LOC143429313 [Xylocopa sonorina]|uniref:uncharacterized protein LOC143429313 n=1 Tax=Xylocopa sonorina TaxID=1818115 RepID=UPI00403B18E5